MAKGTPSLIFGAGGIGEGLISHTWTTPEQTSELLSQLLQITPAPLTHLDSAASYPPGSPWVTETLLGQSSSDLSRFKIDTKVIISRSDPNVMASGHLAPDKIRASLLKSFELMGVKKVGVLHAHLADPVTPMEVTARGFDAVLKEGLCEEIGLCNYNTEQMTAYLAICEKHGFAKPTVYQGHYNAICRSPEDTLYPLLRKHGIRISAYGPLAGGFLTGSVSTKDDDLIDGRWQPGRFPMYPATFDKPDVHAAMLRFCDACEKAGMTSTEVSLRWLMHHSELGDGDALILGASRFDQLQSNVEVCSKGLLSAELLDAAEKLWEDVKGDVKDFSD